MKIDMSNWKTFLVGDIFNIKYGVNLELNACEDAVPGDAVNFVSRTEANNGVSAKVRAIDGIKAQKEGLITVAGGGSVLSTFVQPEPFYSGRDLYTLDAKEPISIETKFFITTILEANKFRYNYGRQANKTLPYIELKLPAKKNDDNTFFIDENHTYSEEGYVPDWQFMEEYIKSLHHKPLTTKNKSSQVPDLNVQNWKEFVFTDIFKLKGGFYNKKPEHSISGTIPFLASTESNNGVTEYYSIDDINGWDKVGNEDNTLDKKIYKGNCIAVTVNGSVCNAFYQKDDFTCSHDITAFYLKNHILTPSLAMFLSTIIMGDKYRWSYGRKPHDVKKFGKSIIKLPVDADGNPNWQFMEDYIKALPYGDRLEG